MNLHDVLSQSPSPGPVDPNGPPEAPQGSDARQLHFLGGLSTLEHFGAGGSLAKIAEAAQGSGPSFLHVVQSAPPEAAQGSGLYHADETVDPQTAQELGDHLVAAEVPEIPDQSAAVARLGELREELRARSPHWGGPSDDREYTRMSNTLTSDALTLFRAGAFEHQPEELLRILSFYADHVGVLFDIQESGKFFNEILDRDPTIQRGLISEFRNGSQDETIVSLVTSRGFIRRLASRSADVHMKSLRKAPTDEDQAALIQYLELEQAILDRCGFTDGQRADITDAWSTAWAAGPSSRLPSKARAEREESLKDISLNLEAMATLYRHGQQAPKLLYEKYGIRNFARYYDPRTGKSVLEPQTSVDYVPGQDAVLTDVEDHNRAFMYLKPGSNAESIGLHNPTYFEARFDKKGIRKAFAAMMSVVRAGGKPIEQLLVNAHGDRDAVGGLTIEDLQDNQLLERLRGKLFSNDAMIMLDPCFTGMRDGIAEYIHKRTDIHVAAPHFASLGLKYTRYGRPKYERRWRGRPAEGYDSRYESRPSRFRRRKVAA